MNSFYAVRATEEKKFPQLLAVQIQIAQYNSGQMFLHKNYDQTTGQLKPNI